MLNLIKTLEDYIKINGERSSGRLVFVLGSLIVFGIYIYDHKDNGVQNIMIAILGYSSASITLSKFTKTNKQANDEIK
jgi:hypothetical protein